MENPGVRVGVGVFVLRASDQTFLYGMRQGSHGANTWALPGGSLELGEKVVDCAAREVLEETGLVVEVLYKMNYTEDYFEAEGKHFVTLYVAAVLKDSTQVPQILEPSKCSKWEWFPCDKPPYPLFAPLERHFAQEHQFG